MRYLIVANQTLLDEHLLEEVRRRCRDDDAAELHLIVPPHHGLGPWTTGGIEAEASFRLQDAMPVYKELGARSVTGQVGVMSPVLAVNDAVIEADIAGERIDEIIVSTLPLGASRWLHQDVVHRIVRQHRDITVTHVESDKVPALPRIGG